MAKIDFHERKKNKMKKKKYLFLSHYSLKIQKERITIYLFVIIINRKYLNLSLRD